MDKSLNEQKMAELERMVNEELAKVDYSKKGCFGTLLATTDDDYCKGCADKAACNAALEANQDVLITEINEAAEVAEAEAVDGELKEMLKPEPKPEPKKADKPVSGKVTTHKGPVKIKTKIEVPWDAVITEVLETMPDTFKGVAAIVRCAVDKKYTASAYSWANKLIAGLEVNGKIEYDAEARTILWK